MRCFVICVTTPQVLNARPGESLGRNAAQVVTDNVKRFSKNGWDAPWEAKREFAPQLATDKIASFIRVTQTESLKSHNEVSDVTGGGSTYGKLVTWKSSLHRPSDPDMMAKYDALRF